MDVDAVQSAEEDGLVLRLVDCLAVAQSKVHVVEENDAAAVDAEEFLDGVVGACLAVVVGCHQAVVPAALTAGLPQPATGHRLAVARGAGQQHAAPRSSAVGLDAIEIRRFEIANGVLPEQVERFGGQDRGVAGRLAIAAAAESDLVEAAVVLAVDGDEVEAPDVTLVAVAAADADEADAL